jgi:hypothetical protein
MEVALNQCLRSTDFNPFHTASTGFNMIRHAIPKKAIRRNTLGTWRPTDLPSLG